MKPLPVELAPFASCILHVAPHEDRASILFAAIFKYWKTDVVSPVMILLFSREKSPNSFS